jgi:hypothetical protein
MMMEKHLEALRFNFTYDPESGEIKRIKGGRAFVSLDSHGYLQGRVNGVLVLAHRAAWALHYGTWPDGQIDHINGQRDDNRLENLRIVSATDNARNAKVRSDSSTGHPGVGWHSRYNKWIARIGIKGRQKTLGYYASLADAVSARRAAEIDLGYHRNHGRRA